MNGGSQVWRNLRHWTLHVSLSASASFIYARETMWRSLPAAFGMIAGILVFISVYTFIWSSRWFRTRLAGGLMERALLYGTRLRSTIGGVSSLLLLTLTVNRNWKPGFFQFIGIIFMPDLQCGTWAFGFIEMLAKTEPVRALRITMAGNDAHLRGADPWVGDIHSLLPTFFTTLAEGILLSLMLLLLSLVCWMVLRVCTPKPAHPFVATI